MREGLNTMVGRALLIAVISGALGFACRSANYSSRSEEAGKAAGSGGQVVAAPKPKVVSTGAEKSRSIVSAAVRKGPKAQRWHVPVGPRLGIVRGKGLGPIRFGATPETVERHMQAPCVVSSVRGRTNLQVCRYSAHAIEFFFKDKVLSRLAVQGRGRFASVKPKMEYGIFNGGFVEGARLGMLVAGVQEFLGQPQSIIQGPVDHPHKAAEIHLYEGARLEFDRSPRGELHLAGVILERPAQ